MLINFMFAIFHSNWSATLGWLAAFSCWMMYNCQPIVDKNVDIKLHKD